MNRRDPYDEPDNEYGDPYEEQPEQDAYGEQYDPAQYVQEGGEQPEQGYEFADYEESQYGQWDEQGQEQPCESAYDQPYEQPQAQAYAQGNASYEQAPAYRPAREQRKPAVLSVNATINLTCTLCAGSGVFGLFLYYADRRSRAVRRYAAQSAGLFFVTVFLAAGLSVLAALLGLIPLIGGAMSALAWIALAALLVGNLCLRLRLMGHAYRGEAYVLPVIGKRFRQFE